MGWESRGGEWLISCCSRVAMMVTLFMLVKAMVVVLGKEEKKRKVGGRCLGCRFANVLKRVVLQRVV